MLLLALFPTLAILCKRCSRGAVGTESKEQKRESRKCKRNTNTKQTGRITPPAKIYSKRKLNKNVVNTNEKEKPNWSNKRMKTEHRIGGIFSRILTLDFCIVFLGGINLFCYVFLFDFSLFFFSCAFFFFLRKHFQRKGNTTQKTNVKKKEQREKNKKSVSCHLKQCITFLFDWKLKKRTCGVFFFRFIIMFTIVQFVWKFWQFFHY